MQANISCMLSSFADYTALSYSKDDVIAMLSRSDDESMVPSLLQEIPPNGIPSQRMQFTAQNGTRVMTVGSNRIDITATTNAPDGFVGRSAELAANELVSNLTLAYEVFGDRAPDASRLAWNTSYIRFAADKDDYDAFRDRFLCKIGFFQKGRLDDMIARFGASRDVEICGQNERLNVLVTVNSYVQRPLDGTPSVTGFRIDYDINTWQGNGKNRFMTEHFRSFVQVARAIQAQLDEELLA